MTAAALIHIGEKDDYFTPEAGEALAAQLRGLGKDVEIHVYPGADHAFFNDTRPEVYDAAAAALLWERSLSLFRSALR